MTSELIPALIVCTLYIWITLAEVDRLRKELDEERLKLARAMGLADEDEVPGG